MNEMLEKSQDFQKGHRRNGNRLHYALVKVNGKQIQPNAYDRPLGLVRYPSRAAIAMKSHFLIIADRGNLRARCTLESPADWPPQEWLTHFQGVSAA